MTPAVERVNQFLSAWSKLDDRGDHIYGVAIDDEPVFLLASDLRELVWQSLSEEPKTEPRGVPL